MADWRVKIPSGVLPKNLPVYVGLALAGVVIIAMLLTGSGAPPPAGEPAGDAALDAVLADAQGIASPVLRQGERLREERERLEAQTAAAEEARADAAARAEEESLRGARQELEAARQALLEARRIQDEADGAGLPPGAGGAEVRTALQSVEERELREVLRLEEIERYTRSLREPAVVGAAGPPPPRAPVAPASPVITGDAAFDRRIMETLAAPAGGSPAPLGTPPGAARRSAPEIVAPDPPPAALAARPPDAGSLRDVYPAGGDAAVSESPGAGSAAVARWADVPEGLDLVYQGRMLQAVLQTQLAGDFTGPARALITVPVRTRDRTRVVIPRGALALGEAQSVANGFQTRLAVAFSRLVFPDGRSVRMSFQGLSALGETGLTDQVNRHYLSTIGAVGAVGLLAGLSAGGGGQGYFDPARQQFSVAAIRFLDRFMNRLPEVRIRAGHPVRIYLTQDLLVPRA